MTAATMTCPDWCVVEHPREDPSGTFHSAEPVLVWEHDGNEWAEVRIEQYVDGDTGPRPVGVFLSVNLDSAPREVMTPMQAAELGTALLQAAGLLMTATTEDQEGAR